ncbi:zinc ribbon domain-containing protein [Clostridium magnum]|uniref:Zinc-ribbon domain-containing protein n=1 Tax=Clostridium magnum DSM 2767 TaxID=1121326 RepID=A0A161X0K0_9CLOT|nr:zinc ribbon domain-containing protein [Clostridium magnum]KZL92978.1 hypothetical protein CLMAG_27920 [Clostridium magnum DSM 2767]SHJ22086.1 hypothetical protein SAMN02745944_05562 [Clostridium magnum DSM 2767]
MICTKCRDDNPDTNVFCSKCGKKLNGSSNKGKKALMIGMSTVVALGIGIGGYSYFKLNNGQPTKSNTSSTSTKTDDKVKEKKNELNGVDIGILTKEDIAKAVEKGKEYKGKAVTVEGKNMITRSSNEFKETLGKRFGIATPYNQVVSASVSYANKYIDPTVDNVMETFKQLSPTYLSEIVGMAFVGGDNINFAKELHMTLKVYGDEEKVLQPKEMFREDYFPPAKPTEFFPYTPIYVDSVAARFDAKEVQKLNPKAIEIIVIYPGGKEVRQKFDYSKLNEL